MENEIAQVLAKLPDSSEIHAKHHALYCWQQERKAKKILHQSRKQAKHHRQQFLDAQLCKSYHHQNKKRLDK